jgi:hypothetical protein
MVDSSDLPRSKRQTQDVKEVLKDIFKDKKKGVKHVKSHGDVNGGYNAADQESDTGRLSKGNEAMSGKVINQPNGNGNGNGNGIINNGTGGGIAPIVLGQVKV